MSKELKDIKKSSVEFSIRKTAAEDKPYGLDKNVTDERKAQHVAICKAITEFADANEGIPMYLILSLGIAQGAPKKSVYAKGYTTFNGKRVESIIRRCKQVVKAMGCSDLRTFDTLSRVIAKFIAQFGNDPVKFSKAVKEMAEKHDFGKSVVSRERYVDVCEALGIDPEQRIKPKRTTAKTPKAEKKSKKTA